MFVRTMSIELFLLIFGTVTTTVFPLKSEPAFVEFDCKNEWQNLAKQLKDVRNENSGLKTELYVMKREMKQIHDKLQRISCENPEKSQQKRLLEEYIVKLQKKVQNVAGGDDNITGNHILPAVAFSVCLTKDVNLGSHQTVVYDKIITNTGNHYSPFHGVFTSPFSGIYLFSASIFTFPNESVHLNMVANSHVVAYLYSNNNGWDLSSQTIVLSLTKGEEVWMQHYPKHDLSGHATLADYYNTFSGVLLNLTE